MDAFIGSEIKKKGYIVKKLLSKEDLDGVKGIISSQIEESIKRYANIDLPKDLDVLKDYQVIENSIQHNSLWTKKNRMLSAGDTDWLESTASIKEIMRAVDGILVSDEESLGRSNFYWRITRPGESSDIGPLHRDEWFWDVNDQFGYNMEGLERVKAWIAIQTEPGLNGLILAEGSHLREDIRYSTRETDTIVKPVMDSCIADDQLMLADTAAGTGVLFHDRLIHGGAKNCGNRCRVSIEFTIIRKREGQGHG